MTLLLNSRCGLTSEVFILTITFFILDISLYIYIFFFCGLVILLCNDKLSTKIPKFNSHVLIAHEMQRFIDCDITLSPLSQFHDMAHFVLYFCHICTEATNKMWNER